MAISNFILTCGQRAGPGAAPRALPPPAAAAAASRCASVLPARPPCIALRQTLHPLPALQPAVGVGAVMMLMSKDVKQSSAMLRRNMRHIRTWLEEQGAAAECVRGCRWGRVLGVAVLGPWRDTTQGACRCSVPLFPSPGWRALTLPTWPPPSLPPFSFSRRRAAQQEIKQVKAPEAKPEPPKTDAPK